MQFQLEAAALLALAATTVSGQYNQTGPFKLHIKGSNANSELDGYASACHAGAAIEGLCYDRVFQPDEAPFFEYYFNYTGFTTAGDDQVGTLTWNMPYQDTDGNTLYVSQPMGLDFQPISNVAAAMFGFPPIIFNVGFDAEGELFGYDYIDDSKFVPQQGPTDYTGKAYYQWAVCWQYFTGYYYRSVAWVQLGAPRNPTCEPVTITKEDV